MKKIYLLGLLVFFTCVGYAQTDTLKEVRGAEDYEKVGVGAKTYNGDLVYVESFDVDSYAGNHRVAEKRAYQKLKKLTAMRGCNLAVVTSKKIQGAANVDGGGRAPAVATLYASVYTRAVPDFEQFSLKIGDKKSFQTFEKSSLNTYHDDPDLKQKAFVGNFQFSGIKKEDNQIILEGSIEGIKNKRPFRVIYFNDEYFTLMVEDTKRIYNIKVKF